MRDALGEIRRLNCLRCAPRSALTDLGILIDQSRVNPRLARLSFFPFPRQGEWSAGKRRVFAKHPWRILQSTRLNTVRRRSRVLRSTRSPLGAPPDLRHLLAAGRACLFRLPCPAERTPRARTVVSVGRGPKPPGSEVTSLARRRRLRLSERLRRAIICLLVEQDKCEYGQFLVVTQFA